MTVGGRIAGIAIATAVCAAAAPSASAGVTSGELDLTFTGTTTNWTTVPGRADQATYDPCESSQDLVGMGAFVIEAAPPAPARSGFAVGKGYNVSIHPLDQVAGGPVDSTHQVADNLFAIDNDLTLGETTTCADDTLEVSYPSAERRSPKRARTLARVACAPNRHVLSGGGLAPGPFRSQRLVSSAPYDSGDPGDVPDDGWRIAVDNLSSERRALEAFAICSPVGGLSYRSDRFLVRKRSRKHVKLDCPPGEFALSGGVAHSARYRKATLVATRAQFPSPVDTWITEVDNLSRKRTAGTSFVICHA